MIGIVSNCWKYQLDRGQRLASLIGEAQASGFTHIELRQTCLGEFESGNQFDVAGLAGIAGEFPGLIFNLAVPCPYFDERALESSDCVEHLQQAFQAAQALAAAPPHLRLVDIESQVGEPPDSLPRIAAKLADLLGPFLTSGGLVSFENAKQSWEALEQLLDRLRRHIQSGLQPRLCYDPANLAIQAGTADPGLLGRLQAADLSMVHLKQSRDGEPLAVLGTGDVDWPEQFAALATLGFQGPWLFEIPPHAEIWRYLQESRRFLWRGLGYGSP